MLTNIQAIILATGKSNRFNTGEVKLLEKVCGQELILYPIALLEQLQVPSIAVVDLADNAITETIAKNYNATLAFAPQGKHLGNADAIKQCKQYLNNDTILIIRGDIPLLTQQILTDLYAKHTETNADISFVWTHNSDPTGYRYNRVITKNDQPYIVHAQKVSREDIQANCCITTGIYMVQRKFLETYIDQVPMHDNEYSLSDLINVANENNKKITTVAAPFDVVRNIKSYQDLWAIDHIKRSELIRYWMKQGVRFTAAQTVHIDLDVKIGKGTTIGCSVHLEKGTSIGTNCTIDAFSMLYNTKLGNSSTVRSHTIINNAVIGDYAKIGPFAHIQNNTTIGNEAQIGNFVEIKNTHFGSHSKAKHLSYLGNTQLGEHVNIGAGTITCNYNGKTKNTTVIKDYVFIGSNNSLVAPVTINEYAFTAAGSTITKDVPSRSLGIARALQTNKNYTSPAALQEKQKLTNEKSPKAFSFIGATRSTHDSNNTFE